MGDCLLDPFDVILYLELLIFDSFLLFFDQSFLFLFVLIDLHGACCLFLLTVSIHVLNNLSLVLCHLTNVRIITYHLFLMPLMHFFLLLVAILTKDYLELAFLEKTDL